MQVSEHWLSVLQVWVPAVLIALAGTATAVHALLNKRDPRGALGWTGLCIVFPIGGPLLYVLFGINRVRGRAQRLDEGAVYGFGMAEDAFTRQYIVARDDIPPSLQGLAAAGDRLASVPLVSGNSVQILHNGEQAYPAMLDAIRRARRYVYLSTYIFETNKMGRQFIAALSAARDRDVDVRVLLDGFGEYYAWPGRRAAGLLNRRGVRAKRFLRPRLIPPSLYINLRNHRKILVADGEHAFTGGMNIGDRHMLTRNRFRRRVEDIHFHLRGPIVRQIENAFLGDWAFVTGHLARPDAIRPAIHGQALCRAIDDGPTGQTERLATLLVAAVGSARQRVLLATPYFLPPRELVGALRTAALRGLDVSVILPGRNNLPYVQWASRHGLRELLVSGVKIYYRPPPFAHSKLFIVDDTYAIVGSANIDARSLRLNFELSVELYDKAVVHELATHLIRTISNSRNYTLEDDQRRSLPARLRDSLAWLFSPYL